MSFLSLLKREIDDYSLFFSEENKLHRKLMFYSEKSGYYKYFEGYINELLSNSNLTFSYVTSDPNDSIFNKSNNRIKCFYVNTLIVNFFKKIDSEMVIMTMPDLGNYHIKKSVVKSDVEYVYVWHGITSAHLVGKKNYFNNYSTIFCVGQHQIDEIREMERIYNLNEKKLIECGYPLIDSLTCLYAKHKADSTTKQVLIAPSWQDNNILDLCMEGLLDSLYQEDINLILRPHPEYIKRKPNQIKKIKKILKKNYPNINFQTDFSITDSIWKSDILITDWSTIAFEFSLTTLKPSVFINTPMKILNKDYKDIPYIPVDISLRNKVGISIEIDEISKISDQLDHLYSKNEMYQELIKKTKEEVMFNCGNSAKIGANYIITTIEQKI